MNIPNFLLLSLGLEYYDFLIFPILAPILIEIFFENQFQNPIINFLFFSLAPLIRIIAPILATKIKNKINITKTIQIITLIMIITTAIIGFLPRNLPMYFYIIIFFILRTAQIFSYSLDMPLTSTYGFLINKNSIKNTSKIILSTTIGSIIALSLITTFQYIFTQEEIKNQYWRVFFIISALIGFITFLSRKNMQQIKIQENNKISKRLIITTIAILIFPVMLLDLKIYFSLYFSKFLNYTPKEISKYQLIGMIFSALFNIIFVKLNLPAKKTYKTILILFLITTPFFKLIYTFSLQIFLILWQLFLTLSMICAIFIAMKNLEKENKIKFHAILYNSTFFIASLSQILYAKLYQIFNNINILFYISITAAIISIIGLFTTKEK